MARRRNLLTENYGMIYDGLLAWFDGINNKAGGGSDNSSKANWYPYIADSSLSDMYIKPLLNAYRVNNGYVIPNNQTYPDSGLQGSKGPFAAINGGDYTFVVVISNMVKMTPHNPILSFVYIPSTATADPKRGGISFAKDTYKFGVGYTDSSNGLITSDITCPNNANKMVIGYKKNSSIDTLYYIDDNTNAILPGTSSHQQESNTSRLLWLGCYCYLPYYNSYNSPSTSMRRTVSNWNNMSGTYHSLVIYNRALSDREMNQVTKFLCDRYGLS